MDDLNNNPPLTTPNIEELIDRLYDWHNTSAEQNRLDMQKAADLLQSQAERIADLEKEVAFQIKMKEQHSKRLSDERDTLRAELAEIAATEPVYYLGGGRLYGDKTSALFDNAKNAITQLFTRPMPAQDVNAGLVELREWRDKAFEAHPNLDLDIEALSKYKGAK